jgi:hypothetical protein
MSRPSLKRYISLNDQDEYERRICRADDNDVNEATGRDETVRASETESCTLNKVDNNVVRYIPKLETKSILLSWLKF